MRVLRSPDASLVETDPAERPDYIRGSAHAPIRSDLRRLSSWPDARALYKKALGGAIDSEVAPDRWIERLAALPLIASRGRVIPLWPLDPTCSALLIARMEDAPLEDVLKRRIFDPLGMTDTGFTVAKEKHSRRAGL